MVYVDLLKELQTIVDGVKVSGSFDHINKSYVPIGLTQTAVPPAPPVGEATIFLDIADGGLKIIFDSGNVAVIKAYV